MLHYEKGLDFIAFQLLCSNIFKNVIKGIVRIELVASQQWWIWCIL